MRTKYYFIKKNENRFSSENETNISYTSNIVQSNNNQDSIAYRRTKLL